MRPLLPVLSALLVSLCSAPASADESFYDIPAPGQLVDLGGGYHLHINCEGDVNSPHTVILDAGLGDWSTHWTAVQNLLKQEYRVCSYDRAGYGWSDPGPRPRDSQRIVAELHSLLEKAGLQPPYLLVGHSFGGLNMRLFASTYAHEVEGLVLVEASHPDSLPYQRGEDGKTPASSYSNQMMVAHYVEPEELAFPPEAKPAMHDPLLRTKSIVAARGEYRALGTSVKALMQAQPLNSLPLAVLCRGKRQWPADANGDAQEKAWHDQQAELARLSARGRYHTAPNSGHHIHLDEPELVAAAVREVATMPRFDASAALH